MTDMKKIFLLSILAIALIPQGQANATAFYIDFMNGNDAAAGTATTTAWKSLDRFTENARSAGDIAFVRRGMAYTTNVSDLNFTSDGARTNPIIMTADYDNLWSDFATSSQTYTVTLGTTTLYASASITGVAAGDWIYVAGDCGETFNASTLNRCEYAYEVSSVSGNALNLYLPYKGTKSGSGNYLRVMPDAPQWNVASGNFQWNFDTDHFWYVKGIDARGADSNGVIELDTSRGFYALDMVLKKASPVNSQIEVTDDSAFLRVEKTRMEQGEGLVGCRSGSAAAGFQAYIRDLAVTGTSNGIVKGCDMSVFFAEDVYYFTAATGAVISGGLNSDIGFVDARFRNVDPQNTGRYLSQFNSTQNDFQNVYVEDKYGQIGNNAYIRPTQAYFGGASEYGTLQSTTTVVRSGGGLNTMEIIPDTGFGSAWPISTVQLFEYPIYANTSSKQYTMYFMSTSTSGWTANPTASELWIECASWAQDSVSATSSRKVTRSTDTINLTGSTAWQSISVTCQPTQTGILYLRGFYGKTKESGKMNQLFMDTTPVIN